MRRADADRLGLQARSTICVAWPASWTPGFGYEFLQREDGLPGLAKAYGLAFGHAPVAMDLSLIYKAVADGQLDVTAGDATSAQIDAIDLAVLEDTRRYFPPYDAVPLVRTATLLRRTEVQARAGPAGRPDLGGRHAGDERGGGRRAEGSGSRRARVSSRDCRGVEHAVIRSSSLTYDTRRSTDRRGAAHDTLDGQSAAAPH